MKILVLTQTLRPQSGWGTYSHNAVRGLAARHHEVIVLVEKKSGENFCREESVLPNPLSLLNSPVSRILTAWKIYAAVKKHKPDAIHVIPEPYALALPVIRMFTALPPWTMVLFGTYGVLPLTQPHTRALMEKIYLQAGGILACSNYTFGQVAAALGQYSPPSVLAAVRAKTQMFRLGIDPPAVRTRRDAGEVKRVVFVGEVKERKGVMELLQGFSLFKQQHDIPVQLDIVGNFREDDPYVRTLREYMNKHRLTEHAFLRGRVSNEELEEAYAGADAFAMLSKQRGAHFEGFGMVFLEANARGIPVIGSTGSGCEEAIDDGVSGYAVDPADTQAVADRLKKILLEHAIDPDACIRWAARHNVDQQTDSIEACLNSVVAAAKSLSRP
jgi:phosphatidyl-myo-inositol dimannoside synthase